MIPGANNGPRAVRPEIDNDIFLRVAILTLWRLVMKVIFIMAAIATCWILDRKLEASMTNETIILIDRNYTLDYTMDFDPLFDFDAWGLDEELVDPEAPADTEWLTNEMNARRERFESEEGSVKDEDSDGTNAAGKKARSNEALIIGLIRVHYYIMIREVKCGIPMSMEMIVFFDRLFNKSDSSTDIVKLYQEGMQYIDIRAAEIQRVCGWN